MSVKKKIAIIIGGLFTLVALGVLGLYLHARIDRSAVQDGTTVKSGLFTVELPEGAKLTSDSDSGSIFAMVPENYGELRVGMYQSSSKMQELLQRGEVTKYEVTVDGVPAEKREIDYSKIIPGRTEVLNTRFEVAIPKVNKPSEENYTTITISAMSKRALTDNEKKSVSAKADEIIRSVVIK